MDGVKEDTINIRTKAENKQQAEAKAKASLHEANSKQVTGSLEMEGDPLLMAGQNVTLAGFNRLSGLFNIVSAEHSIDRQGYTCSIEIKKVSK
jgi:phage protein D